MSVETGPGSAAAAAVQVPPTHERVLAALGPGIADRAGPLLPALVRVLTSELDDVAAVTVDDPRGPAVLYDLDASPRPGFLGQYVGVPFDTTLSRAQQIARVRSRGQTRGTPRALDAAARGTLTPVGALPAVVELVERDGSAYRVRVRTYAAETPDPAATKAALLAAKPVGLVLIHELLSGWSFGDAVSYGGSFAMLRDSGATFGGYARRLPDNRDRRTFAAAQATTPTFLASTSNTFARWLRPHEGRNRATAVRSFSRLTTRSYAALRGVNFASLSNEGA